MVHGIKTMEWGIGGTECGTRTLPGHAAGGCSVRAVRVIRHGRPTEAIEVQDIPVPDVEPGGVRVAVSAASINFGDIARCRGGIASVMSQPPFTLGMDVCGVVHAAASGAEHWLLRRL